MTQVLYTDLDSGRMELRQEGEMEDIQKWRALAENAKANPIMSDYCDSTEPCHEDASACWKCEHHHLIVPNLWIVPNLAAALLDACTEVERLEAEVASLKRYNDELTDPDSKVHQRMSSPFYGDYDA